MVSITRALTISTSRPLGPFDADHTPWLWVMYFTVPRGSPVSVAPPWGAPTDSGCTLEPEPSRF